MSGSSYGPSCLDVGTYAIRPSIEEAGGYSAKEGVGVVVDTENSAASRNAEYSVEKCAGPGYYAAETSGVA